MSLATLLPNGCLWIEKLTYGLSCSSLHEALIYIVERDHFTRYTYDERIVKGTSVFFLHNFSTFVFQQLDQVNEYVQLILSRSLTLHAY